MISAVGHVVFYALVAAASPLVLTAMLAVVRGERPRTNGIAFLLGFLLGTTTAAVRLDSYATVEGVLALLLGIALVVAGLRERHVQPQTETETGRGNAVMARLSHLGSGAVLPVAGFLGFGGPKRLSLTFLAMASASQADLGDIENLALIVLYVAVATLLVSVPVGFVAVGGSRGAAMIGRGESWLKTNAAVLRVWLAIGFGAALVVDGIVRLTG